MTIELRPLPPFDFAAPSTLPDLVDLLARYGDTARLLAGGTDLIPRLKKQKSSPRIVIDINHIPDLSFIALRETALHIGAATRLATLYESPVIREKVPALADAVQIMSSPGIRNRATIGGNLCNAARCADTPAPLLVYDAHVKLLGPQGDRLVALRDFFIAPGSDRRKTVARPDEVMTEIIIPLQTGHSTFLKLGRRIGSSTAIISAATLVKIAGGKFTDARIAVSAFGSTPLRARKVETALIDAPAKEQTIRQAAERVMEEIDPITDFRASSAYRKEMAALLIQRAVTRLAAGRA
ncbi:MAG: xanthine dehydrogenase family protein subunit M [Hyphomicrobiales bacterium]|nr:xanthine dehydrogenase family protein subunit M [Hyphomicrobiales bacterium]